MLVTDLLVKTIGDGGGGGLVDDTLDVDAGNGARILGGLTLKLAYRLLIVTNSQF